MLRGKRIYFILHLILAIYSLTGICSKKIAISEIASNSFIQWSLLYVIFILVYALVWQQIIKSVPLMVAYSNKAVVVIWGMFWGNIIYDEMITLGKLLGAFFVICGIILYNSVEQGNAEVFE